MERPEVIRETLAHATGSEKVWRLFRGRDDFLITEGAKAMADMCEAWWLLTDIAAWFCEPKVRKESFTVWILRLDGKTATLTGEDGNGNEVVRQEIPYTDFPLTEGITLFKDGNVIMLPSEY
ncbi:MAG: hypothetical protein IJU98_02360 [Synergistaceae bacterium]|nr:hypothetical protein [Synergistaceae bacterium]